MQSFYLLVLCAGVALDAAPALDKPFYPEAAHAQHFAAFKTTYNKQYATPEEEQHRFEIFKNNLIKINQLNAKYKETVYAINKFTDLTTEEVIATYTGLLVDENSKPAPPPFVNLSSVEVPDAFDWRDKKAVTRVKDQETCGSCWAFATIGSLEGSYAIKNNKLVEFSEQQLISCSQGEDTSACNGGYPLAACSYIMSKGAMTESNYPYINDNGTCHYDAKKVVAHAKVCKNYARESEDNLKKLLYTKGPMAIGIDASSIAMYHKGILTKCDYFALNHAVLLVGYGTENGVPFWTIKNSWGTIFGDEGYFKMQRGVGCLGFTTAKDAQVVPVEV